MTNKHHNVLYVGCTKDIIHRVYQHKKHFFKGSFTDRYNCEYCVYFEEFPDYQSSIKRENELKNMTRAEKIDLIVKRNPDWKEIVTESGFCEKPETWSNKVERILDEIIKEMEGR